MKAKLFFTSIIVLLIFEGTAYCQPYSIKLMCWNLLNYPDASNAAADTALRHPFYRSVVRYEEPDILVTEENTMTSATTWFLNQVMNDSVTTYSKGTFINGPDTDNEIYFKTAKFTFISNVPIHTDLRYISEFTLVHIPTGDTIRIYAVHLKASSGSPNDQQRAEEVDSLRKVTNMLPAGSNFLVCGDFNIYGDYESAYQKLLQDNPNDDGNFNDPFVMTGVWHSYSYRYYHTQSTRTISFGGGSTGGMNDRFDMILFSNAIDQGSSGISYVPGSTTPVGNDGNHYNQAINVFPNTAAPNIVVNAVYNASDHLPVFARFNFIAPSGISMNDSHSAYNIYPNPLQENSVLHYQLKNASPVEMKITDVFGRTVYLMNENQSAGKHEIALAFLNLACGLYFMQLESREGSSVLKLVSDYQ
jgi:hypothetical protein